MSTVSSYQDSESLTQYMQGILKYPRITREREQELSKTILHSRKQKAVEHAVNELVLGNLRLVPHCMKDFTEFLNSADICLSRMDLIAEGNIALLAAARSYNASFNSDKSDDPSLGSRFSTYACRCIRSRILRALKLGRLIRIPERHFSFRRRLDELEHSDGAAISDRQIAHKLGIGTNRLGMVRLGRQCKACRAEDMKKSEDSDFSIESFPADPNYAPDREVQKKDLKDYLCRMLNNLDVRTRMMITEMFLDPKEVTLRDLSVRFKVSKERCRQICAAGLSKLRKFIEKDLGSTFSAASAGDGVSRSAASPVLRFNADEVMQSLMQNSGFLRDVA